MKITTIGASFPGTGVTFIPCMTGVCWTRHRLVYAFVAGANVAIDLEGTGVSAARRRHR